MIIPAYLAFILFVSTGFAVPVQRSNEIDARFNVDSASPSGDAPDKRLSLDDFNVDLFNVGVDHSDDPQRKRGLNFDVFSPFVPVPPKSNRESISLDDSNVGPSNVDVEHSQDAPSKRLNFDVFNIIQKETKRDVPVDKRLTISDYLNLDTFNVGVDHSDDVPSKREPGTLNIGTFLAGGPVLDSLLGSNKRMVKSRRAFNAGGFFDGRVDEPVSPEPTILPFEFDTPSDGTLIPVDDSSLVVSDEPVVITKKEVAGSKFNIGDPTIPPEATASVILPVQPPEILPPPIT